MESANSRTLAAYEGHVAEYLAGTSTSLGPELTEWLAAVVAPFPRARILEIGSGPGTIAHHLIGLGHRVDLTDAALAFVENLRLQGHPARELNVLTDPVPEGYDVILANAVFLHLTREQFATTLRRLPRDARLAFTVKQGEGEEWSTAKLGVPRYFCYWQPAELIELLHGAGYSRVEVTRWTAPSGQSFLAVIAAPFVPAGFAPPPLRSRLFQLEPLSERHNDADLEAWTGSIEQIRDTPGFAGRGWPSRPFTAAENLRDVQRHERHHAELVGFTYAVLSSGEYLGCVYFYPSREGAHDVDVRSWVRRDRAGLDEPLYREITAWLRSSWPWVAPAYAPR